MIKPWQGALDQAHKAAETDDGEALQAAIDALLRRWGNHHDAVFDAAALLLPIGELGRAEALLQLCHQLNPGASAPLINLATVWQQSLRQKEALALDEALARQQPGNPPLLSRALTAMAYRNGATAQNNQQLALRWAESLVPTQASSPRGNVDRWPLRIGVLSADLCQHPVGLFLLPLAQWLSERNKVELVFYDNSPRLDWLSEELQRCGRWQAIQQLDHDALAATIERDDVSVLLELGGHTAGSRLAVLQRRPAPCQLSWLGYWGTTGLRGAVDGVLVDPLVVPPGSAEAESFVEPLMWLPQSRWVYRPVPWMPEPVEPPCLRRGFITFGSFNNAAKLSAELLSCWAKLLKAVPHSRLRLKNYQLRDVQLRQRITTRMAALGINAERLELHGPSFHQDLLASYGEVDIALDTFPFNGGLTSCEALWLGLPLVSLAQNDHAAVMAARQGLALLTLIGRDEWIARSMHDYVRIATELASAPELLREMRSSQRERMQISALCDEQGFCEALLDTLQRCYRGSHA